MISVNILFFGSRFYCDYDHYGEWFPNDSLVKKVEDKIGTGGWWILRCNLYAITFLVITLASYLPKHKYSYFFMALLIGFSISDVIDRTYFNVNTFTKEDWYMITFNLIFSYAMSTRSRKRLTNLSPKLN